MAGIFSSLFKQRKPKQFGFKPLYYNAKPPHPPKGGVATAQGALRKNEIREELESEEFRKLLREKWRKNFVVLANKKSNIRIIVIAVLLAVICFLILR